MSKDERQTGDARITSRDNALLKLARAARDGRERDLIFIEGLRLGEEAARAGLALEVALYTDELRSGARGTQLLAALHAAGVRRMHAVDEALLATVADTKTPQGVIIIAVRPPSHQEAFIQSIEAEVSPLIVVLHGVGNPANAGSILRVAEAAGAAGAVATRGAVDLFAPKALRGAMGSSLRLPVWAGATLAEVIAWCNRRGVRAICIDARAPQTYTAFDWAVAPAALILGGEGSGLDAAALQLADASVSIPMRAPVESLNVAVAGGIILYEAARQRSAARVLRTED